MQIHSFVELRGQIIWKICCIYTRAQRLFFSLYSEHLRFTGDEIAAPAKKTIVYKMIPKQKVEYVKGPDLNEKKGIAKIMITESIPLSTYMLTPNCTCLIRRLNWAIWTIDHEKDSLLNFWGTLETVIGGGENGYRQWHTGSREMAKAALCWEWS